jgi:hypothetical protein
MRQHYDRLVVFFEGGSRQKSECIEQHGVRKIPAMEYSVVP